MSPNWTCRIVSDFGDIEVALGDEDQGHREWIAEGPGGLAVGSLRLVLAEVTDHNLDPAWLEVVEGALLAELGSLSRSELLVKRESRRWFHATFSRNRDSIRRFGLDHRRMVGCGIAGSMRPEAAGVFLGCDLETARWFAQIGSSRELVDIWAVDLRDDWLVGDPGDGGGGGSSWMISPKPIDADQLTLLETDLHDPFWPEASGPPA